MNNDLPTLIGLTGNMGVGKNTVAKELAGFGYEPYGFADALKRLAYRVGWDGTKANATLYAERGGFGLGAYNGRLLLQELGVGARIILGEDVWIKALFARLDDERPLRAVITDVRFPNEAEAIRQRGGVVIAVRRPGFGGDGHESEEAVSQIEPDAVIVNDLRHLLREKVRLVLSSTMP